MKRFKNILLVTDGVHTQDTALQRAVSLAEHNQADLTIIHALNLPRVPSLSLPGAKSSDRLKNDIINNRQDQLEKIAASGPANVNIRSRVIEDAIFPAIIQEVLRSGYDLIMKSAEETSSRRDRIFGSTDMRLLRKCPCPVWIMKSNEKLKYQRIFAAVDVGDDDSNAEITTSLNRQILEMASSLALSESSELHIVHAWTAWFESWLDPPPFGFIENNGDVTEWVEQLRVADETKVKDLMKALTENIGEDSMGYLMPEVHIVKGEADQVILRLAREKKADLIVMGTIARTGIPGLIIGNTAESILNKIGCSVLVVKPPGFITPVQLDDK